MLSQQLNIISSVKAAASGRYGQSHTHTHTHTHTHCELQATGSHCFVSGVYGGQGVLHSLLLMNYVLWVEYYVLMRGAHPLTSLSYITMIRS